MEGWRDGGWRARARIGALALVIGFSSQAIAFGLGDPTVASRLGQTLRMTVPLRTDPGVELSEDCARLVAGAETGDAVPSLDDGQVTIDPQRGQLRIESRRPISEPTLRVVVEIGCAQFVRRAFTLLLDPPAIPALGVDRRVAGSTEDAPSLELGMAQISAVLGQRLSLKVPVIGPDAGQLTADCVHLSDPISSEGAPVLRRASIDVVPQETGSLIEVATAEPATEPAVRLALDVGCGAPLRREYAILLGSQSRVASSAGNAFPSKSNSDQTVSRPVVEQAQAATPSPAADRLVLSAPPESAAVAHAHAAQSAELIKRLDTTSREVETLRAELIAAHRLDRDLERRAAESGERWTWLTGALGAVLLGGALVTMAWHRRQPIRTTWEPIGRAARPVAVGRAAATRAPPSVATTPEIGGRARMAHAPPTFAAATEPNYHRSEITVTELHDTVQVIKELYATVLARNTSSAGSSTGGPRPVRPLDLDLRAPGDAGWAARVGQPADRGDGQVRTHERFTELPTEAALDLDLRTFVAPGHTGQQADARSLQGVPLPEPARRNVFTEDHLTQSPTEVLLDIDLCPTRAPFDLQLDLDHPGSTTMPGEKASA